jgi:hypothetical protein
MSGGEPYCARSATGRFVSIWTAPVHDDSKTRMPIVNSPSNPVAAVSADEQKALVESGAPPRPAISAKFTNGSARRARAPSARFDPEDGTRARRQQFVENLQHDGLALDGD